MVTKRADSGVKARGRDGLVTGGAVPEQEDCMSGTGEEVSHFPIQAVVGDALVETQRADLGGLIGEEKAPEETSLQSWLLDGSMVRGGFWLEIERRFIGIFDDGEDIEMLKGCRESMQCHLIEGVLAEEEEF
jgi:hypothetical protein